VGEEGEGVPTDHGLLRQGQGQASIQCQIKTNNVK
jgi:hypothetical protein